MILLFNAVMNKLKKYKNAYYNVVYFWLFGVRVFIII